MPPNLFFSSFLGELRVGPPLALSVLGQVPEGSGAAQLTKITFILKGSAWACGWGLPPFEPL